MTVAACLPRVLVGPVPPVWASSAVGSVPPAWVPPVAGPVPPPARLSAPTGPGMSAAARSAPRQPAWLAPRGPSPARPPGARWGAGDGCWGGSKARLARAPAGRYPRRLFAAVSERPAARSGARLCVGGSYGRNHRAHKDWLRQGVSIGSTFGCNLGRVSAAAGRGRSLVASGGVASLAGGGTDGWAGPNKIAVNGNGNRCQ